MGTAAEPGSARTRARGNPSPAPFDRSSRLVLGLVVAFLLLALGQKAYRLSLPTEGWLSRSAPDEFPVFRENLMGEPSPLRPGDMVLAVEGVPFSELRVRAVGLQSAPLAYRSGGTARYTVLRNGAERTLDVPLYSWSFAGVARAVWLTLTATPVGGVYTWLAFLLAAYVFWKRPRYLSAQLFLLLQTVPVAAAISYTASSLSVADTLFPAAFYLARMIGSLAFWLIVAPLGLHFIASFPEPVPALRRWWILGLIYGVPWLVFAAVWVSGYAPLVFALLAAYNLLGFAAVVRMVAAHRDPPRRAQVRWFGFGYGVSSLITVLLTVWRTGLAPEVPWLYGLLFDDCLCDLVYVACAAVAILWYRLFDIDVILNRALVYGGLTLGVVGLYALVVGGVGGLVGAPTPLQGDVGLSLLATGLVALAFDPLRHRLQRAANRLLYGHRDEPYRVLSALGERMEGTLEPSRLLPAMTETIAGTLKLPYAAIALGQGNETRVVASHGAARGGGVALPLMHQGEAVGELRLEPRAGETFKAGELNLLRTIARQASVAAFTIKQNLDLQRSREALVAAREEERLRIRRDLHDGLGPELASLAVKLDATRNVLGQDPARADRLLLELKGQTQEALAGIRRLVYALRPPALDELGLEGALREQARGYDHVVDIELSVAGDLGRLPPATEVACYRIAQEALTNVVRHARATRCRLTIRAAEELLVEVQDDGVGLPAGNRAGVGLRSMRERAEELGGTLTVASSAGGTRLLATLPLLARS